MIRAILTPPSPVPLSPNGEINTKSLRQFSGREYHRGKLRYCYLGKIKMKRILAMLTILAVSVITANAVVLTSDTFTYPNGSLTNNAAWSAHSGAGSAPVQVVNGAIVVDQGSGSREDVHIDFATASGGSVYAGFDFSVADLGGPYVGTDNEYFAHFNSSAFFGQMDIVAAQGSGDFRVGIATDNSIAEAVWGTDLSFDTTYRAIIQYDIDNDQATLWIDAATTGDTSIQGIDGSQTATISSFSFRQSDSSKDETITVDNLIVGTGFNDVVPEPATVAMFGIGGLIAFIIRRSALK